MTGAHKNRWSVLPRGRLLAAALVVTMLGFTSDPVRGQDGIVVPEPFLVFDTELVSLDLTGVPVPIPLAQDPFNLLGDSVNGYGFVDSDVLIQLSSQNAGPPSLGKAIAFPGSQPSGGLIREFKLFPELFPPPTPLTPGEITGLDGQNFTVDSFFDVFFDITVTDVDSRPGRDYAGQPDGASFTLPNNFAEDMISGYVTTFLAAEPNFGLIPPPEVSPYIGHFDITIPLNGDINGNGEPDKLKFTLATHSVGDGTATFIILPDGTVIDSFDSAAALDGAILDIIDDPPFSIGGLLPNGAADPGLFGGPTTATSLLQNQIVPEPSTLVLTVFGLLSLVCCARRRRERP